MGSAFAPICLGDRLYERAGCWFEPSSGRKTLKNTWNMEEDNEDWKMRLNERASRRGKADRRAKSRDLEHKLQVQCVKLFGYMYPKLEKCLFAVPNGGRRDAATGAKLRDEGVRAGVADLFLCVAASGRHGLFIEMKTEENGSRQSEAQKEFGAMADGNGYGYVICRTVEQFKKVVTGYLEEEYDG